MSHLGSSGGTLDVLPPAERPWSKVTALQSLWGHLMPRVRMQIVMAGVCFSNYLIRCSLGTYAVLMVHEYRWDLQSQGILLGAFFWGYLVGNLVSGVVAARFGAGIVLGFAAIAWSCLTIAVPLAADYGLSHVWLLLTMLGFVQSPLMCSTTGLLAMAFPASERGCAIAVRALALRGGHVVATVLTPLLCTQVGWKAAFVISGTMSFLFAVCWLGFVLSKAWVADMALKLAEAVPDADASTQGGKKWDVLPWHVFGRSGFLAVLAVHCSNNFVVYTILSWGPTYFTEVLGLPLEFVGLYLVIPASCLGLGSLLGGLLADRLQRLPWTLLSLRKRLLCPAAVACGSLLALLGKLQGAWATSLAMATAALLLGLIDTTQNAVYMDLAPHSATTVVCLGNSVATLPGAAGPALVTAVLHATGAWSFVWGLVGGSLVVAGGIFALFGSVDDMEKKASPKYMQV